MNLYFLVEGKRTEKKLYSAWLRFLLPEFSPVDYHKDAKTKNYFFFTAGGYPTILDKSLSSAIAEVNESGQYNYLIICLDADESTVAERESEIQKVIIDQDLKLDNAELITIVQNRCIETWLLGNRKIYTRNPNEPTLLDYTRYYNVSKNDPELMGTYHESYSYGQFHDRYLREMFKAKNLTYSKKRPGETMKEHYLSALCDRITSEPTHLQSFRKFIQFCDRIAHEIT